MGEGGRARISPERREKGGRGWRKSKREKAGLKIEEGLHEGEKVALTVLMCRRRLRRRSKSLGPRLPNQLVSADRESRRGLLADRPTGARKLSRVTQAIKVYSALKLLNSLLSPLLSHGLSGLHGYNDGRKRVREREAPAAPLSSGRAR